MAVWNSSGPVYAVLVSRELCDVHDDHNTSFDTADSCSNHPGVLTLLQNLGNISVVVKLVHDCFLSAGAAYHVRHWPQVSYQLTFRHISSAPQGEKRRSMAECESVSQHMTQHPLEICSFVITSKGHPYATCRNSTEFHIYMIWNVQVCGC